MEQQTGSKLRKKYIRAIYCHPAYLTCRVHYVKCMDRVQTTIKIAGRNIDNFRYTDDTILMAEREKLKILLMKVKSRVKKLA